MKRMTTTELSQDSGGKVLACRTLRMWLVAIGIHRLPRDRDCSSRGHGMAKGHDFLTSTLAKGIFYFDI